MKTIQLVQVAGWALATMSAGCSSDVSGSGVGEVTQATASSGITQVAVASAVYQPVDVKVKGKDVTGEKWKAHLDVKGNSTIAVRSNTAIPGATTGWHSHPGISIVSVTEGEVTNYHGNDSSCTREVITAGNGFVEAGDDVHILRNEGKVNAKWTTTAVNPMGVAPRIDAANPGNCPF